VRLAVVREREKYLQIMGTLRIMKVVRE